LHRNQTKTKQEVCYLHYTYLENQVIGLVKKRFTIFILITIYK